MAYIDRTSKAFKDIEEGVKNVYKSDNFKKYLSTLSKFHNYSLNNTIMILMQNPNASFVAGYDAWKRNFNRHVIPGGKSMQIIAPYQVNVDMEVEKKDNLGNVILLPDGKPQTEIKKQKITKFHLVNVFDISQTEGEPLPTLVHNLTGSNAQIRALMKAIQKVSDVPIELKTTATDPEMYEQVLLNTKAANRRQDRKSVV